MIRQSLGEVGAARSIVIDENGVVLAGNGVVEAAADAGIERVQIVDTDGETIVAVRRAGLTPEQKTRLALYDNRAGELSDWEPLELAALLEEGFDFGAMFTDKEMVSILDKAADSILEGEDAPLVPEYEYVPDVRFPGESTWDIPILDVNRQALALELPVERWGSKAGARTRKNPGTWHFYTSDDRFEALWANPLPVVLTGCAAAVEPNFTVTLDSPRAFVLWNVYRKRWIARFWQLEGVRVWVDLNVPAEWAPYTFLGVPHEWRAYMTRGYTGRMEATENEWRAACEHHGSEDIVFVVYGGGKQVKAMCEQRGWGWLPEETDRQKGKYADG